MLLDRCRRKLNQVIFPLQNTNWKTDFIFKNSVLSLPADILGKKTISAVIHFLKERSPELLIDHIYFKVDFIFPSNFTQVVIPAQNKRSLATNLKKKKSIFLHFLFSTGIHGICFSIISNRSPSHPEHPCICGWEIKLKKKNQNQKPHIKHQQWEIPEGFQGLLLTQLKSMYFKLF